MAKFKFVGLEEYAEQLSKLASEESVRSVCGASIYAGADVAADAIRDSIDSLPVVDYRKRGSSENKISGITQAQKDGLRDGFGITPMKKDDGYYNVKIGFNGYNNVKTKKYPSGQPNSLIARSVNSGTSFREKIPFVDSTVRKVKPKVEKAMEEKFDSALSAEVD